MLVYQRVIPNKHHIIYSNPWWIHGAGILMLTIIGGILMGSMAHHIWQHHGSVMGNNLSDISHKIPFPVLHPPLWASTGKLPVLSPASPEKVLKKCFEATGKSWESRVSFVWKPWDIGYTVIHCAHFTSNFVLMLFCHVFSPSNIGVSWRLNCCLSGSINQISKSPDFLSGMSPDETAVERAPGCSITSEYWSKMVKARHEFPPKNGWLIQNISNTDPSVALWLTFELNPKLLGPRKTTIPLLCSLRLRLRLLLTHAMVRRTICWCCLETNEIRSL